MYPCDIRTFAWYTSINSIWTSWCPIPDNSILFLCLLALSSRTIDLISVWNVHVINRKTQSSRTPVCSWREFYQNISLKRITNKFSPTRKRNTVSGKRNDCVDNNSGFQHFNDLWQLWHCSKWACCFLCQKKLSLNRFENKIKAGKKREKLIMPLIQTQINCSIVKRFQESGNLITSMLYLTHYMRGTLKRD